MVCNDDKNAEINVMLSHENFNVTRSNIFKKIM